MAAAPRETHFDCGLRLASSGDFTSARAEFEAGEAAGDVRAGHLLASFVSGGIGGPRDWSAAIATLRAWEGRDAFARRQIELIDAMGLGPDGAPAAVVAARKVHSEKEIRVAEAFLSPRECELIVALATPHLEQARIRGRGDEPAVDSTIRDAELCPFRMPEEPPFIRAINARIAAATETDALNGEPLQVIRYRPGQQYRPHLDVGRSSSNRRSLTALIYLNDGFEGGETAFPRLDLAIRGNIGDLIIWPNLTAAGAVDPDMLHAGLPVTAGEKFVASRWIRQRPPYDEKGNFVEA